MRKMHAMRALYENHSCRDDGLVLALDEFAHYADDGLRLISVWGVSALGKRNDLTGRL